MSRIKVNSITPFTGANVTIGGNAIPSGSGKTLGTESNPWTELYVSTSSIAFVNSTTTVARLRAGGQTTATGIPSGQIFTETTGNLRGSFSVGRDNQASGTASLANGFANTSSGNYSHAEGFRTLSSGVYAHAEGSGSTASGAASHAEGEGTIALGFASHTEGLYTVASGSYQTVVGEYNAFGDTTSHFIVGGGTSGARKDAFKVTVSSSIVVATQSAAPTWTGVEGEMVPFVSGSVYRLYAYLGGAWRSSSFA